MNATTLLVMRHAKAADDSTDGTDYGRPLTVRGRDAAQRMGRWIHEQFGDLPLVLSSPALRTRETLDGVLAAWPEAAAPSVRWDASLYLAPLATLLEAVETEEAPLWMLLGHNPGVAELVLHLVGAQALAIDRAKPMPTAAFYAIRLPARHRVANPGSGLLLAHMRPRLLPPSP